MPRVRRADLPAVSDRRDRHGVPSSWRSYLLFRPPLLYQRLLFGCAMIVLFVIDLEHRILPNVITLPGIVVGFAVQLLHAAGMARFA